MSLLLRPPKPDFLEADGDQAVASIARRIEQYRPCGTVILVIPFPSKEERIGETVETLSYHAMSLEVIVMQTFTS